MLSFLHLWVLCLLPLPLLVRWLLPPCQEQERGVITPFFYRLKGDACQGVISHGRGWVRTLGLLIIWVLTLVALARPQVIEPPITRELPGRDLLLAIDLSGSMETTDLKDAAGKEVSRLDAVKEVVDDFLSKRNGDRVGLIFFGSAPMVQAPFTTDLDVCRTLLGEAEVRMLGPQTVFGDALGLAITVFQRSTIQEKVLIVLTDGNDTNSKIPPDKAAAVAKDQGIVIHTLSVGDPAAAGENPLDVESLKKVAASTGGIYAHAADQVQLQEVYRKIGELETRKVATSSHRPKRDVYWWPVAAALLLSAGMQLSPGLVRGQQGGGRRDTGEVVS